jgi:hypothetical protein
LEKKSIKEVGKSRWKMDIVKYLQQKHKLFCESHVRNMADQRVTSPCNLNIILLQLLTKSNQPYTAKFQNECKRWGREASDLAMVRAC